MDHFHVFARQEGEAELRVLAADLTEAEVKRRIVRPYRRGTSIVHGGTIIPIASLRELRICKTSLPFDESHEAECVADAEEIALLNRSGDLTFVSPGPLRDNMAECFDNVTEQFLRGREPGDKGQASLFSSITNHPIISTVVGGLLLAAAVFYLGIK